MVGTQNDLMSAIKALIELDYDSVEAYEAALNRLENNHYKSSLEEFKSDHERHIDELCTFLKANGVDAPDGGSMKQVLTQGKVVLGGLVGDQAILKAMLSNEGDTNTAYERMNQRSDIEGDLKDILARGLEDEKKHAQWIKSNIDKN